MRKQRRKFGAAAAGVTLIALGLAFPPALIAQSSSTGGQAQTETVVAGAEYGSPAGPVFFFGADYRDLWTLPIDVPVLDLRTTGGGLQPVTRIGGNETLGLALKGNDGRDYTFRSINKDLSGVVPIEFQGSMVQDIVQDQIAGNFPGVQVIVPTLLQAAGVLTVAPVRLVVLPDDPALGQYQEAFAGVLGVFMEYPQPASATNPGFHGATEILGHEEFWQQRQAGPAALPDTSAFLRARLIDILLNDWDRQWKQWRWARIPGEDRLQPIPEDRDQVFADYEGAALGLARFQGAQFVTFSDDFPSVFVSTKNGWDVDRFLLTDIDKTEWSRIAAEVQAALTDEVIDAAMRQLPPEYFALRGAEIATDLKGRRDKFADMAASYYEFLAGEVDVQGSNADELAVVDWLDGGGVEVSVAALDANGNPENAYYRRRFQSDETNEVRIYLHGGNDKVVTRGRRSGGVKVRVIGGPGNDEVDDSQGSGVEFYDAEGNNRVVGDNGTHLRTKPFPTPDHPEPNNVAWVPDRDWGRQTKPLIVAGYHSDPGFILGAGFDSSGYGFRKEPSADRHILRAAWAFGVSKAYVDYVGAFRREDSNLNFAVRGRSSGIEQLRYYGLGNETSDELGDAAYRISNYQTSAFAGLAWGKGTAGVFAVGPFFTYSTTGGTNPDSVLGQEQPLGFGEFGEVGLVARANYDTRGEDANVFAGGFNFEAKGEWVPELWDVEETFGSIEGEASGHIPLGNRFLVTLTGGGKQLWGNYPFFEAAYLGGYGTLIGLKWNRYAGDASLYGISELRWVLKKVNAVAPGEFGLAFEAGAGRVFLEGEDSNTWHPSYGIGVFYSPFQRTSYGQISFGKADDDTFVMFLVEMRGLSFK